MFCRSPECGVTRGKLYRGFPCRIQYARCLEEAPENVGKAALSRQHDQEASLRCSATGSLQGSIEFDGQKPTKSFLRQHIGPVPLSHHEARFPSATVVQQTSWPSFAATQDCTSLVNCVIHERPPRRPTHGPNADRFGNLVPMTLATS